MSTQWVEHLGQDLRYGLRRLSQARGFTAIAVLTLALGIGANTAVFSVLNAVLLRPLPYPQPDRLVQLLERNPTLAAERGLPSRGAMSAHNYDDYRELNTVFQDMGWAAPLFDRGTVNVVGGDRPVRVPGVMVSASLFSVLGIEPRVGRVWAPEADTFTFEGPRVVILGSGFWNRRFGADPNVVGRTITIDGWPHTVVGVLPPTFRMPPLLSRGQLGDSQGLFATGDLYVPLSVNAYGLSRGSRQFTVVARLRPGVGLAEAQGEMSALAEGLARSYPRANDGWDVQVVSLSGLLLDRLGPQMALLMAAVGLVLLVACANIANLQLARGVARRDEMAIRTAIGGTRWQLARQLATESLLLAGAGGAAGVLLAYAGHRALVSVMPAELPRAADASIDPLVLGFACAVTVATGLLFGLAPTWRGIRVDFAETLHGRAGVVGTVGRRGAGRVLVAGQVALALILLVGAGLLTRSFLRLALAESGYDPENVLRVSLYLGRPNVYNDVYWDCDLDRAGPLLWGGRCQPNRDARKTFFNRVIDRVEQVPGVVSVALTNQAPLVGGGGFHPLRIEPEPGGDPASTETDVRVGSTGARAVYPGYFQTMGIRILRGRAFRPGDPEGWEGTAVINATLANRLWPEEDPIGRRLSFYGEGEWMTIVGVVEDTADTALRDRIVDNGTLDSKVYHLGDSIFMDLLVRTVDDPVSMAQTVEDAVLELDAGLPLGAVNTLEQLSRESTALPRSYALLVGIFATFALLLTALGLYGVVAATVDRRTREIGLRLALGAGRGRIRSLVVRQAMGPVVVGMVLGGVGAIASTRVLDRFLYGMDPVDPVAFASVALLLVGVALAASYLPAWKASRLDPMWALRHE